jgi:hypothetical protein
MSASAKESRCGFAVIKLLIRGKSHFLMRRNLAWKDVNFVGGHENARDKKNLKRAAHRELMEEVPSLRAFDAVELEPLAENVAHGPVFSASARRQVNYTISFFLVRFTSDPQDVLEAVGPRSMNVLVSEEQLFESPGLKRSMLVDVLDKVYPGGLRAVPYSWQDDLQDKVRNIGSFSLDQTGLALH